MPDATLHTTGPVLERLGPVLYRTELPNGKIILAHLSKRLAEAGTRFEPGQRVVLELTPYDFDQARILGGEGGEWKVLFPDTKAAEDHA
ncbi:MAG: translation initiation factor IF-1 [Verrucomicrobia bacterium]|nr:translation initiation factor IF-1 [Verrucomicrobiota bacterium]